MIVEIDGSYKIQISRFDNKGQTNQIVVANNWWYKAEDLAKATSKAKDKRKGLELDHDNKRPSKMLFIKAFSLSIFFLNVCCIKMIIFQTVLEAMEKVRKLME